MVSLERIKRKVINFYDDQEIPNYIETPNKDLLLADAIATGQIFAKDDPAAPKYDELINFQSSLTAALYQVRSLIEMIEVCGNTENTSFYSHSLPVRSGKYLSIKPLNNQRSSQINWAQRIGLKHKTIQESHEYIMKKAENIKQTYKSQQKFIRTLQEVNKRWKIVQQGNLIFAVIGKSNGKEVKVLIQKDLNYDLKVELFNEMKAFQVLDVIVECNLIQLPEVCIRKSSEFEELERASQVLIDDEIYKKINEGLSDSNLYYPRKVTKQEVQINLYTEDEITISVSFKIQDNFKPNGLFKSILVRLHSENPENLMEVFCKTVAHSHVKIHVHHTIIDALDEKKVKYKMKEKKGMTDGTVFSVISETQKCKIIDVEVSGVQVFATAYTSYCINKFIPATLRARIYLRELKSLIFYIIELQNEYLKLILDSN